MKKLRFLIALWASKACLRLLRLLKRNATCTPGKIALAIDKKFLGGLRLPETVIAVTGTNGKTTVSNLLTDVNLSGKDVAQSLEKATEEAKQLIEAMK